jgi:hypothetical protein
MAKELSMNGRKKIETIQREFSEKFNYLTLIFLDDENKSIDVYKSLSEVRTKKGPDISIIGSLKVNTLEKRFNESFGLKVEVAYSKGGKVFHTKDSVDKTLNELNSWCGKNGCEKFEFNKKLTRNTLMSVQEQLFNAIKEEFPDAVAKKINKDNFMDVHLPSVNPKRGTHLFFNTAKEGIKFGFYCRDEQFTKSVLHNSSSIEEYGQGIRPLGNPTYDSVEDALEATLKFLSHFPGVDMDEVQDSDEDEISENEIQENSDESDLDETESDKEIDFDVDDFEIIHTLVIIYSAFANQSGLSESSLDILIDRIKLWDFKMSEDEKNSEIMKALKWFTKNYDASLFSRIKLKLNELSALSESKRITFLEDLRMISNTFFEIPSAKIQLYSSIITNLGFKVNEYGIDVVSNEMIENFNNAFDDDYKSTVLENFREEGYVTIFSIGVSDLVKAVEVNKFLEEMLHPIGKADLGDWDSVQKLTSAEEVSTLMKDFKDVNPDFIVLLYCQGNYIHAFSSE